MACALQGNLVDCKRAELTEQEMQEQRSFASVFIAVAFRGNFES